MKDGTEALTITQALATKSSIPTQAQQQQQRGGGPGGQDGDRPGAAQGGGHL